MKEPTKPLPWAAFLGKLWGDRFPVDVRTIAMDYSKRFPDPIKTIQAAPVENFEGALCPLPNAGKWAILYNPAISSPGRINFTLAHELGHYLVHRHLRPDGFECGERNLLGLDRDTARKVIEQEADLFASHLLMPKEDFRAQVRRADMTLELLAHCAERYGVSRTAAALKWIDLTDECAVVVAATNGFILWSWRSARAKQRGLWFPIGMELPEDAWAASTSSEVTDPRGMEHDAGTWHDIMSAREMTIFAPRHEMTISVLIFGDANLDNGWCDEPVEDTYDRFTAGRS